MAALFSAAKGRLASCVLASAAVAGATTAQAGSVSYDFTADPIAAGIIVVGGNGINPAPYVASGGNPGGFLALTYPVGGQYSGIVFDDIDDGKIVSSFNFKADLRVGNSTGDRAADGFSVSFARSNDPVLVDAAALDNQGNFAGGIAEGGTTTGIAIDFDTWSGNTLPDGGDIEGIIVRVDNVTVLRYPMPTRHGSATDATSLQTGPRDAQYWADGGEFQHPDSWKTLSWVPLEVDLDVTGKLTVKFKNTVLLDKAQTAFFPSAGRIVLAGRTGGANEHTHFDNISLTTTAAAADTVKPTAPGAVTFASSPSGARRVALSWGASTDDSGRVAYSVYRDGTKVGNLLTTTSYTDLSVSPGKTYKYEVEASDVSGNTSARVSGTTTTAAEVASTGFLLAEIYDGIGGNSPDALFDDAEYLAKTPDRGRYINGLSFGEPNFGDTYGETLGVVIRGVLTAPESGDFDFFIRSDDGSRFYLSTDATIPAPESASAIAEETGCCGGFEEPGAPETTATPIALVAGKKYGFAFVVKEGGGGDWGQVAMRKVGDTTPANQLPPIRGALLTGVSDAVGAVATITKQPADVSVAANESAQFYVLANTSSPYTTAVLYQWYKNGSPIAGANGQSYTVAVTSAADNGAKFKVLVAVPGLTATSTEATLTVTPDNVKPSILTVTGDATLTKATVWFSEAVTAPSATTAANYSLSGGLTVSAVTQINSRTVELTTSAQTAGGTYTLTVNGVSDAAGNLSAATGTLRSRIGTAGVIGKVTYSFWDGVTSLTDAALSGPATSTDATYTSYITPYGGGEHENFVGQLKGLIQVPANGDWVFAIAADDDAALYLSTDESPANKVQIAQVTAWDDAQQWTTSSGGSDLSAKRSDQYTGSKWTPKNKITLTAGKSYYLEALYHEGGGGDHAEVTAWPATGVPMPNGVGALTTFGTTAPLPQLNPNILSVNDAITPSSANSPGAEGVKNVLDGDSKTKYLNFDKLNTGFTVTPAAGASIIDGISLTSANDAIERDPASYLIEGSNDGVFFQTVASGTVPVFSARFTKQTFTFNNSAIYKTYRVTFPTVNKASSANSMQVADVALHGTALGGAAAPAPTIAIGLDGKITYTGTLHGSDNAAGPFAPVAGATSPFTPNTASGPAKFYRSGN